MAKGRPYVVPMTLDEALHRLEQIEPLGIRVQVTRDSANACEYEARRVRIRRDGGEKALEYARGKMVRSEDDHTRVEPQVKIVAVWRLVLVYGLLLILGIALAAGIALATEGVFSTFDRRALAVFISYGVIFVVAQPQRLFLGSASDNRLHEYIKHVLSGPYADAANLYEQYFGEKRYWETR